MRSASGQLAVLFACLALAACGGDDEETTPAVTRSAAPAEEPGAATTTSAARAGGLAKPILANCGVEKFGKPATVPLVNDVGRQYWRVIYQLPMSAPRIQGQQTQVTVVEQAPARRGKLEGGRDVRIAGRNVNFRRARSDTPSHVALWVTDRARYTLLADGSVADVRRMIRCMP